MGPIITLPLLYIDLFEMLSEIIYRVLAVHPDFSYEEVEEVCELYLSSITEKIK